MKTNIKKYTFECRSCEAEYTISFEPIDNNLYGQDITCCPFCGDDCERQDDDLEKDEDDEENFN
jgi:hypothetical protein